MRDEQRRRRSMRATGLLLSARLTSRVALAQRSIELGLREPDGTEYESAFQADVAARAGVAWVLEF
jgi:hypothetical protein